MARIQNKYRANNISNTDARFSHIRRFKHVCLQRLTADLTCSTIVWKLKPSIELTIFTQKWQKY